MIEFGITDIIVSVIYIIAFAFVAYVLIKAKRNRTFKPLSKETVSRLEGIGHSNDLHDYESTVCGMRRFLYLRDMAINHKSKKVSEYGMFKLNNEMVHLLSCMVRYAHRAGCEVRLVGFESISCIDTTNKSIFVTNFESVVSNSKKNISDDEIDRFYQNSVSDIFSFLLELSYDRYSLSRINMYEKEFASDSNMFMEKFFFLLTTLRCELVFECLSGKENASDIEENKNADYNIMHYIHLRDNDAHKLMTGQGYSDVEPELPTRR